MNCAMCRPAFITAPVATAQSWTKSFLLRETTSDPVNLAVAPEARALEARELQVEYIDWVFEHRLVISAACFRSDLHSAVCLGGQCGSVGLGRSSTSNPTCLHTYLPFLSSQELGSRGSDSSTSLPDYLG